MAPPCSKELKESNLPALFLIKTQSIIWKLPYASIAPPSPAEQPSNLQDLTLTGPDMYIAPPLLNALAKALLNVSFLTTLDSPIP